MPKSSKQTQKPEKFSNNTWATKRPMLPERHRAVRPEELCVGAAVWLRQRFENEEDIPCVRPGHCKEYTLTGDGYMHPMVVLKFWQRPGSTLPGDLMVAVSEMTGFRANTTLESFNKRRSNLIKFTQAIAILHKNESKYKDTEQLSLQSGFMQKKSWIRLQHVLLVPISYFWKYDWHMGGHAYDQRLSEPSYKRLMYLFNMEEDEYESTFSVVQNATSRLARLASRGSLQNTQSHLFGIPQVTTSLCQVQQFGEDKENFATNPPAEYKYFHGSYLAQGGSSTQGQLESGRIFDEHKASNSFSVTSQLPHTYSSIVAYFPSSQATTVTSHPLGGSDTAMATNQSPEHMAQYQTSQTAQPGNSYPAIIPPRSQPAVQKNTYYTGPSYHFNGANHNFGMMPGQHMTPKNQQLAQQWQQSLNQQQQALNQYFGHMQAPNAQQALQQMEQPLSYGQMANPHPHDANLGYRYQPGQSSYTQFQPQSPSMNNGAHNQPPHRRYNSVSSNSAGLDFPAVRNHPSTTSNYLTMQSPTAPMHHAFRVREQISSPYRTGLYHSPQVEDYDESESGNAAVQVDFMTQY